MTLWTGDSILKSSGIQNFDFSFHHQIVRLDPVASLDGFGETHASYFVIIMVNSGTISKYLIYINTQYDVKKQSTFYVHIYPKGIITSTYSLNIIK